MSALAISVIAFLVVLGGSWIGAFFASVLPKHHLSEESKDMIKVGIGFLATLAAMVLGLLVASAKSSYDTKVEEIQQIAAKLILLDRNLREVGPSADPIRANLRQLLSERILPVWERGMLELSPTPTEPSPPVVDDL